MSNWTTITTGDLAGAKIGAILATATGAGFDVNAAIADVTARLRSAVNAGNVLDADATKIPNSLKALALRQVQMLVKSFLEMPLNDAEKSIAADDSSFLRRIIDEKLRFETPDNPMGTAEMQDANPAPLITRKRRRYSWRRQEGL